MGSTQLLLPGEVIAALPGGRCLTGQPRSWARSGSGRVRPLWPDTPLYAAAVGHVSDLITVSRVSAGGMARWELVVATSYSAPSLACRESTPRGGEL